jgi:hypothetical protein
MNSEETINGVNRQHPEQTEPTRQMPSRWGWGRLSGSFCDHEVVAGPTTIRPSEELSAVRQRMSERHVPHLLVTTPDGELLGLIRGDNN